MLVIKNLNVSNGYAKLMPIGDIHWGAKNCERRLVKEKIEQCLKEKIYVIGMGDMIEMATRTSPGSGVYEQTSPQVQMEDIINLFKPLKDAGLLIGILTGNHEDRATIATGLDVTKIICRTLDTPYLGSASEILLRVGEMSYRMHVTHGSTGGATTQGKLKGAMKVFEYTHTDLVLYGHTHGLSKEKIIYHEISKKRKVVEEKFKHVVLTGSFLSYAGSYAEQKNLHPSTIGTALITLASNKFDIKIEI